KSVVLRDLRSGSTKEISVNGVFIEVGFEPRRELLARMGVELDDEGFIKVNDKMETNLPGVFAAGDCTNMWKDFRQVVTAAAMGAVAAYSAYNYLLKAKGLEGSHAAP
ncbi:TPA: thioredoxin reductase, partial [Candidatus Micrarchaeota archaeon]|nr:thioredoxin reductase [Candidatus Micrarchaeota archaeon]